MKINPAVLFLALFPAIAAAAGASFSDSGTDSEGNDHQARQVHVKHNFLQNFQKKYTNKNEREEAYEIIDRGHIESSSYRRSDRYPGKVRLSSAFLNSLKNHVGIFSPEETHDSAHDAEVSMHTYVKSSAVHRDHYTAASLSSDHRSPPLVREDRDVVFVLLNTNKDAYFQHGDTSVPIKEGSLVHFNGRVPHNTVIKSGTVEMIGPFELNPLGGKRGVVSVGILTTSPVSEMMLILSV